MITNETRAKLIGWTVWEDYHRNQWWTPPNESKNLGSAPAYDTDANAVAELRAFVRARGKVREFLLALAAIFGWGAGWEWSNGDVMDALDATPAQQTAAFDAVFADELSRIE